MNVPEIGEGICFGIGGTNYRVGHIDDAGNVRNSFKFTTPGTPGEFFGQAARILLEAADNGATWGVMGVPGPVSVEWDVDDVVTQRLRVTNIPALKKGFDPVAEMADTDPAAGRLLRSGEFDFLSTNDGHLAVLAGIQKYITSGASSHKIVGALFPGTGIGAHIAHRDNRFTGGNLFHPSDEPWEIGHLPPDFSYPSRTYESNFAGPGLAKLLEVEEALEIPHDDPIWSEVGHALGCLTMVLALNGGAKLVVVSGGIGIGEQRGYSDEMRRTLDTFRNSHNPMNDMVPEVQIVPIEEKDTYEMLGARGAILSHLVRRATDRLVQSVGLDIGGTSPNATGLSQITA